MGPFFFLFRSEELNPPRFSALALMQIKPDSVSTVHSPTDTLLSQSVATKMMGSGRATQNVHPPPGRRPHHGAEHIPPSLSPGVWLLELKGLKLR